MKNTLFIIILLCAFSTPSMSQGVKARTWEPKESSTKQTYKLKEETNLYVFIRDNRTNFSEYGQELKEIIVKSIKESYPETTVKWIKNLRESQASAVNKAIIILDISDYFSVDRNIKWIGQVTYHLTIIDMRSAGDEKFEKTIQHNVTKAGRNGLKASEDALAKAFKGANSRLNAYIFRALNGKEKAVLIN